MYRLYVTPHTQALTESCNPQYCTLRMNLCVDYFGAPVYIYIHTMSQKRFLVLADGRCLGALSNTTRVGQLCTRDSYTPTPSNRPPGTYIPTPKSHPESSVQNTEINHQQTKPNQTKSISNHGGSCFSATNLILPQCCLRIRSRRVTAPTRYQPRERREHRQKGRKNSPSRGSTWWLGGGTLMMMINAAVVLGHRPQIRFYTARTKQ